MSDIAGRARAALTLAHPEIWADAVSLAERTTGITYIHKDDLFNCGFVSSEYLPPTTKSGPIHFVDDEENMYLTVCGKHIDDCTIDFSTELSDVTCKDCLRKNKKHATKKHATKKKAKKYDDTLYRISAAPSTLGRLAVLVGQLVPVPDGAIEWLLHEVGHWVVATPRERALPNYGFGQEAPGVGVARELGAWGFEEIILSPWGPARTICPPPYRGGVGYRTTSPFPSNVMDDARRGISASCVNIEEWQEIISRWMNWERGRKRPSWERYM